MTATKTKGRKALSPAVNVRMSESSMPILIDFRQGMERKQGRRVTDREALDTLLKLFYTANSKSE